MSFSESGRTSQNVSVMSKGVWPTAQKFAYALAESPCSSGTMVKLSCFVGSDISILSHDADHHALQLHQGGIDDHRLHGRIGRLQAHAAVLLVELLQRDVRPAQQGNHHL